MPSHENAQALIYALKEAKMSKHRKSYFPQTGFTGIPNELIDSEVFMKMTSSAKVAYLLLLRQKREVGQPSVKFPYKDARKYLNASTFSRAIGELTEIGLIDLGEAKRMGSDIRQPNIYVFSYRWKTIPIGMAISKRCPKRRNMNRADTGCFSPKIGTVSGKQEVA